LAIKEVKDILTMKTIVSFMTLIRKVVELIINLDLMTTMGLEMLKMELPIMGYNMGPGCKGSTIIRVKVGKPTNNNCMVFPISDIWFLYELNN
jgi:hypothetical protein